MMNIKKCLFSGIITLSVIQGVMAQTFRLEVPSLPNEKWWGGLVALGNQMPFHPRQLIMTSAGTI